MQEFKCEICGQDSYWGRRAFERHFKEFKHQNGMRALGIPNSKLFFEVTSIADARELWRNVQVLCPALPLLPHRPHTQLLTPLPCKFRMISSDPEFERLGTQLLPHPRGGFGTPLVEWRDCKITAGKIADAVC